MNLDADTVDALGYGDAWTVRIGDLAAAHEIEAERKRVDLRARRAAMDPKARRAADAAAKRKRWAAMTSDQRAEWNRKRAARRAARRAS